MATKNQLLLTKTMITVKFYERIKSIIYSTALLHHLWATKLQHSKWHNTFQVAYFQFKAEKFTSCQHIQFWLKKHLPNVHPKAEIEPIFNLDLDFLTGFPTHINLGCSTKNPNPPWWLGWFFEPIFCPDFHERYIHVPLTPGFVRLKTLLLLESWDEFN